MIKDVPDANIFTSLGAGFGGGFFAVERLGAAMAGAVNNANAIKPAITRMVRYFPCPISRAVKCRERRTPIRIIRHSVDATIPTALGYLRSGTACPHMCSGIRQV